MLAIVKGIVSETNFPGRMQQKEGNTDGRRNSGLFYFTLIGGYIFYVGVHRINAGGDPGKNTTPVFQRNSNSDRKIALHIFSPAQGVEFVRVVANVCQVITVFQMDNDTAPGTDVASDMITGDRAAAFGE